LRFGFVLFFLQPGFGGPLLRLQFGGALRQLFLRQPDLMGQRFLRRFGGLHSVLEFRNLVLTVGQIFGWLIDVLLRGHISIDRHRNENDRYKKQNPFPRIRLRFHLNRYLFAFVRHSSSRSELALNFGIASIVKHKGHAVK